MSPIDAYNLAQVLVQPSLHSTKQTTNIYYRHSAPQKFAKHLFLNYLQYLVSTTLHMPALGKAIQNFAIEFELRVMLWQIYLLSIYPQHTSLHISACGDVLKLRDFDILKLSCYISKRKIEATIEVESIFQES